MDIVVDLRRRDHHTPLMIHFQMGFLTAQMHISLPPPFVCRTLALSPPSNLIWGKYLVFCTVPGNDAEFSLHVATQVEPQPKTATELLLAEEEAAAAAPSESESAPEFAPQPAGSNNPFGASAFGGAGPAGAYAQVDACP